MQEENIRQFLERFFRDNPIPHNTSREKVNEILNIKIRAKINKELPSQLYRYRRADEKSINAFENDLMYLSYPSCFNDPFDALLQFDETSLFGQNTAELEQEILDYYKTNHQLPQVLIDSLKPEYRSFYNKVYDELVKQDYKPSQEERNFDWGEDIDEEMYQLIQQGINCLRESCRVACFSESIESILMWSHYAESHTGFALSYEISDNKELNECIFPMVYTHQRYDAQEAMRYFISKATLFNNVELNDSLFYIPVTIFKDETWSYEKEWRYLDLEKNINEPIKAKPSAIYYGCQIKGENKAKLHRIAQAKGIKEYDVKVDNASPEYRMAIIPCSLN